MKSRHHTVLLWMLYLYNCPLLFVHLTVINDYARVSADNKVQQTFNKEPNCKAHSAICNGTDMIVSDDVVLCLLCLQDI